MGQMVSLKCQKCGYEAKLWVGAGMIYNVLDNVVTFFDSKTQAQIRDTVKNNPECFWSVSKEIGICDKCGKISAIAVFKLTDKSGKFTEYRAKCQCGNEVEIMDLEKVLDGRISLCCPVCQDPLTVEVMGHWD